MATPVWKNPPSGVLSATDNRRGAAPEDHRHLHPFPTRLCLWFYGRIQLHGGSLLANYGGTQSESEDSEVDSLESMDAAASNARERAPSSPDTLTARCGGLPWPKHHCIGKSAGASLRCFVVRARL